MTKGVDVGSRNKWVAAGCGFFLATVFAVIGIGAFLEHRLEAIPLGLIMSFLAANGFWSAMKRLRARKTSSDE
ncbi:hypothetical protein [Nevskia ramosa]|uniref:hypothetical protein n=1 Tax=Nevskia ramosa TaxID=64002 RepID=UPI0023551182|nr:hypothetical protein [Nevskia ramosa]